MAKKTTITTGPEVRAPASDLDPRSDVLLLRYTGDRGTPWHVPQRDLHGNDLGRIAYQRALANSGAERPGPPTPAALQAIHDELLATGAFEPWTDQDQDKAPDDEQQQQAGKPDDATDQPDADAADTPTPAAPADATEAQA
jgi:hypothetical protein